ncbi:VOC family protein [Mollicutes bacterium LVI A0039]|nr:VOC family protein [Mollicutes bacterium LVI A0039]
MELGVYFNFLNESKQAISFYEQVFNTKAVSIMTYEQMGHPKGGEYNKLVLNAEIRIHGAKVLISDIDGHDFEHNVGNNITMVVNYDNEQLLEQEYAAICENGTIITDLTETFWAQKYAMVIDQFGIGWQFNLSK